MKVGKKPIVEFLDRRGENFLIPVYQRNYDWKKENCEVLWDDLEAIIVKPHPHFFGSIVRVRDGDDNVIIDGQQRLTTISLLMLAIAHRMEILGLEQPDLSEVMDLYQNGKRQPKLKLKLLREDMQAYECIVANKGDCTGYGKSKIVQNYDFFYKKLDSDNLGKIFEATKQLIIIDVLLEDGDDNPQAVFESLNDKGEKLNDADKIRNFILMNFDYEKQKELYNEYWAHMEKNVGLYSEDTTKYIMRFIQYKNNTKFGDKYIYSEFKSYIQNKDKETVLKELFDMSKTYRAIMQMTVQGENSDKINRGLKLLLNKLQMNTTLPLLLDVIKEYESGRISGVDVEQILNVLISYIIRRGLVGDQTGVYNTFFLMNKNIHNLLNKFPNGTYLDIVKYIIYTAKNKTEIPDDNTVSEMAMNFGIYNKNTKICECVLVQLEKYLMLKNDPNSQRILNESVLSIEHIMPQTLSGSDGENWKKDLGEDWQNIHGKYLHTLGNLTLTAYNSNLSNRAFYRKKQELANFAPMYLNQDLMAADVWNKDAIFERGKKLSKLILLLWPIYKPNNEYVIQQTYDQFDLSNDNIKDIVTGRKPRSIELQFSDTSLNVTGWRDLYVSIINELYNDPKYKEKMQNAFDWADQTDMFNEIISKNPQVYGKSGTKLWERIIQDNTIYFKITKSAEDMCRAIIKWLKYLGLAPDDVTIVLR